MKRTPSCGCLPTESGVFLDLETVLSLARYQYDDGERADIHQRVGQQIEQEPRSGRFIGSDDRHHEVTRVRDPGIGEHPLDAHLHRGDEIGDHHREHGQPPQNRPPILIGALEGH